MQLLKLALQEGTGYCCCLGPRQGQRAEYSITTKALIVEAHCAGGSAWKPTIGTESNHQVNHTTFPPSARLVVQVEQLGELEHSGSSSLVK